MYPQSSRVTRQRTTIELGHDKPSSFINTRIRKLCIREIGALFIWEGGWLHNRTSLGYHRGSQMVKVCFDISSYKQKHYYSTQQPAHTHYLGHGGCRVHWQHHQCKSSKHNKQREPLFNITSILCQQPQASPSCSAAIDMTSQVKKLERLLMY